MGFLLLSPLCGRESRGQSLGPVRHCLRGEAKEVRPDERAEGSEELEVYSLEYIEELFRAEHAQIGRGSFAAVERSLSDRLLVRCEEAVDECVLC